MARDLCSGEAVMNERVNHYTIIVGASPVAEDLRRWLVRRDMPHAGIAAHIGLLRRALVLSEHDLTITCIALDRVTLDRHGRQLRTLLADSDAFPTAVRSIGLLSDLGLTSEVAELGCDVYVQGVAQAVGISRQIARFTSARNRPCFAAVDRWRHWSRDSVSGTGLCLSDRWLKFSHWLRTGPVGAPRSWLCRDQDRIPGKEHPGRGYPGGDWPGAGSGGVN